MVIASRVTANTTTIVIDDLLANTQPHTNAFRVIVYRTLDLGEKFE